MESATMVRTSLRSALPVLIVGIALTAGAAARAGVLPVGPQSDPAGDFRTFDAANPLSFAGPDNPALDVLSVNVVLDTTTNTFTFTQTMAGPISGLVDATTHAILGNYSWGINHGFSNLNF